MSFLAAILNRAPLYIIATIQTANTILRPRPRRCRRHVLDTEGYEKGEEKKRKGKKKDRTSLSRCHDNDELRVLILCFDFQLVFTQIDWKTFLTLYITFYRIRYYRIRIKIVIKNFFGIYICYLVKIFHK